MSTQKGTVLVVDDEPQVLESTAEMVRSLGYHVIEAASGPEALEKSAPYECTIDLLLTDLIMPGMTGRLLADTLSARCPGLEVIFMSGFVSDSRLETVEQDLHYIQKPFDPEELGALLRGLLKKKRKKI